MPCTYYRLKLATQLRAAGMTADRAAEAAGLKGGGVRFCRCGLPVERLRRFSRVWTCPACGMVTSTRRTTAYSVDVLEVGARCKMRPARVVETREAIRRLEARHGPF